YRGKPVTFEVIGPWTRPSRLLPPASEGGPKLFFSTLYVIFAASLGGGLFYARRNLRLGRGDRRGAKRLLLLVIALAAVSWILSEHHVATPAELRLFVMFAGWAMFGGGFLWML